MFLNCGVGELEIPSDCKEIKPVNPQGNPSWKITGRTDAEAEVPIHWPPDAKSWLLRKDPDVGKDWRQEEKGITEDEIIGWHHQLNGHEFEHIPRLVTDRKAWHAALHGVAKSWTWLSNWNEPVSNFLEEISSLSYSVIFLYSFVLLIEEGLVNSLCYSLELCFQLDISFPFSFAVCFSSFLRYL